MTKLFHFTKLILTGMGWGAVCGFTLGLVFGLSGGLIGMPLGAVVGYVVATIATVWDPYVPVPVACLCAALVAPWLLNGWLLTNLSAGVWQAGLAVAAVLFSLLVNPYIGIGRNANAAGFSVRQSLLILSSRTWSVILRVGLSLVLIGAPLALSIYLNHIISY